ALSAGHKRTCGISSGHIYCWGMEIARVPGQPAAPPKLEPTRVPGDRTYTAVSVGNQHACALAQDGAAFCWGRNHAGELGDGSNEARREPVAVTGGHRFARISAGGDHTCALDRDGRAYCWGS